MPSEAGLLPTTRSLVGSLSRQLRPSSTAGPNNNKTRSSRLVFDHKVDIVDTLSTRRPDVLDRVRRHTSEEPHAAQLLDYLDQPARIPPQTRPPRIDLQDRCVHLSSRTGPSISSPVLTRPAPGLLAEDGEP